MSETNEQESSRGPGLWRENSPAVLGFVGLATFVVLLLSPLLPGPSVPRTHRQLQAQLGLQGAVLRLRNLESRRWAGIRVEIECGQSQGTFRYTGFAGYDRPPTSLAPGADLLIPLRSFVRVDGATLDPLRHHPQDILVSVGEPPGELKWRHAWGEARRSGGG